MLHTAIWILLGLWQSGLLSRKAQKRMDVWKWFQEAIILSNFLIRNFSCSTGGLHIHSRALCATGSSCFRFKSTLQHRPIIRHGMATLTCSTIPILSLTTKTILQVLFLSFFPNSTHTHIQHIYTKNNALWKSFLMATAKLTTKLICYQEDKKLLFL